MNTHKQTRALLYDFLKEELPLRERQMVADHLARCETCRHDLEILRAGISLLPLQQTSPADQLPHEYWNEFADTVLSELGAATQPMHHPSLWTRIETVLVSRWRFAAGVAGALAILGGVFLFRQIRMNDAGDQPMPVSAQREQLTPEEERLGDYFRRSKMLLVGLTNLKPEAGTSIDLSNEQQLSRELVHETRYFRQQRMNPRATRLIGDLERILIELANMEEQNDLPDIEMIRSGIRQENLLFKIRMAEAVYDTARFIPVNNMH